MVVTFRSKLANHVAISKHAGSVKPIMLLLSGDHNSYES